ncbi:hypothetical protein DRE_01175 [Drechslerella stenobrocha 248]|uniref:Uncharacterized protein n=1 Tax=Drechslerella stenobrocha 248 TaxID=1043628 RepID=W7HMK0_9PEZI|nr:hypothetical protein DRE_01175 [Drechslerella stenobrocha 248]
MVDLCRNSRFIFDFDFDDALSFVRALGTMRKPIAAVVRSIVATEALGRRVWWRNFVEGMETLAVVYKDQAILPFCTLKLLEDGVIRRLEVIRSTHSSIELEEPPPRELGSTTDNCQFTKRELAEDEIHDRGRYIFNSFHKVETCYYQERATLEDVVTVFERDGGGPGAHA